VCGGFVQAAAVDLGFKAWVSKLTDTAAAPEMSRFGQLMGKACASITDDELRSAMQKAIFPNGIKLPTAHGWGSI
jgi:hypothetical protein